MRTKLEYILAQLHKARNKKYESYVVSGIYHGLKSASNEEIKLICQQHISRPEGRALTDAYFPQLNIHIEIDEAHHLNQVEADAQREADIIDATGHEIWRVPITKNGKTLEIAEIDKSIKHFTKELNDRINLAKRRGTFKPWNLEEHTSEYWLKKGEISLTDDCSFHYNHEAANCFGLNLKLKSIWTGGRVLPAPYKYIWFPKLYPNGKWHNVEVGERIIEKLIVNGEPQTHPAFDKIIKSPNKQERIVFAHTKDNLGTIMYRFKGLYTLDITESNAQKTLVWKRQPQSVKTYKP